VDIVEARESWPAEFASIGATLRRALGDTAARIDHIGSTSVPGLAGKDRIDVQVSISARDWDGASDAITSLGYRAFEGIQGDHRPAGATGPDADWQKRFFSSERGERGVNIHVRESGRANERYALLFRDYLRSHPNAAAAYAELKRRLAVELRDPEAYPDVKDPACDLIAVAAEEWATQTGWRPGPSDA
jgi:GrpB-like predicted nucleotidyltransferase (UPF0157 family)